MRRAILWPGRNREKLLDLAVTGIPEHPQLVRITPLVFVDRADLGLVDALASIELLSDGIRLTGILIDLFAGEAKRVLSVRRRKRVEHQGQLAARTHLQVHLAVDRIALSFTVVAKAVGLEAHVSEVVVQLMPGNGRCAAHSEICTPGIEATGCGGERQLFRISSVSRKYLENAAG